MHMPFSSNNECQEGRREEAERRGRRGRGQKGRKKGQSEGGRTEWGREERGRTDSNKVVPWQLPACWAPSAQSRMFLMITLSHEKRSGCIWCFWLYKKDWFISYFGKHFTNKIENKQTKTRQFPVTKNVRRCEVAVSLPHHLGELSLSQSVRCFPDSSYRAGIGRGLNQTWAKLLPATFSGRSYIGEHPCPSRGRGVHFWWETKSSHSGLLVPSDWDVSGSVM